MELSYWQIRTNFIRNAQTCSHVGVFIVHFQIKRGLFNVKFIKRYNYVFAWRNVTGLCSFMALTV